MNSSIPLILQSVKATGQKYSKNVSNQDVNKIPKKRRQIDRSHITTIPGTPETYKCNVCEKVFRNKKGKCYHDACITGIKPYKCNVCDKTFIKRSHFEYHERVHTGYKPFKCPLCDKAFPQKNKLNRHMSSHKQEKQFLCKKCDKRYSKKEDLKNHMSIHTGLSQHVCKSCGKTFRMSANLVRHMHTHSNERPHVCDFCSKSFKDKSLLIRHKKTHGKDRPFSCAHCSRFFLSKSELSRHLAIHTDIKPFSCTYCQTVFRRKDNLNRHIRHHHADNSNCNETSKSAKEKESTKAKDTTQSSDSVSATVPAATKLKRVKKKQTRKSLKPPEIVSLSSNSSSKLQAVSLVNSREENSQRDASISETRAIIAATTIPIPIRRPGELSNAVPVINGPIMGKNWSADYGPRKKTFTHTEPIPLAEAVGINRRIEEKLYPQSSGSNLSSNYYFFRKHTSMNDPTTPSSLGNNSESYSFNHAKPIITANCNRAQIGAGYRREISSHAYSLPSPSDSTNSAGPSRGKCDVPSPMLGNRRASAEKRDTLPQSRFIESANSVPTIQLNKRVFLQDKGTIPKIGGVQSSDN